MKNSRLRRLYFYVTCTFRFIVIGFKNPSSFKYTNYFDAVFGRFWSFLYSQVSGLESKYYVPETFFYNKFERNINDFNLAYYLEHKGYLNEILGQNTVPNIVNCISRVIYKDDNTTIDINNISTVFSKYNKNTEFVLKVSVGTGGGKGVTISTKEEILSSLKDYYKKNIDFVVQEKITQHRELAKFNLSSLNTIRVLTLRDSNSVHAVSTVFRMGNGGKVDNSSSGGIAVGVNPDGTLKSFAVDHEFEKYEAHPFSNICFSESHYIPDFENIINIAKYLHHKLKSHALVSWDLTIDDDLNISVIEFNVVWSEINFHQATNGPIFESYTDYLNKYR